MPRPSPQTDRVVAIIGLLTERAGRGATLTEIAHHVGQTPAACVHVLAALARAAFVVRQPTDRRYHLGPALIAPGHVAAGRFPRLDATRAALEALALETGRPALALRRDGAYARVVEVAGPADPSLRLRTGDLVPIEPPLAAVLVAWSGPEAAERWLGSHRGEPASIAALRDRLAVARAQGFVVELLPQLPLLQELSRVVARSQDLRRAEGIRGPLPGIEAYLAGPIRTRSRYDATTVSAPVAGPDGRVDLALVVTGFTTDVGGRALVRIGGQAVAAAARLRDSLADGEPGAPPP